MSEIGTGLSRILFDPLLELPRARRRAGGAYVALQHKNQVLIGANHVWALQV